MGGSLSRWLHRTSTTGSAVALELDRRAVARATRAECGRVRAGDPNTMSSRVPPDDSPQAVYLAIPEPYRGSLAALARLDEDRTNRLLEAMNSAAPLLRVQDLERLTLQAFSEAERRGARNLIPAVLSLRGQLRTTSPNRLAAVTSASDELELTPNEREQLAARLEALLATEALSSTANAVELLTQNPRNYRTARVLTDVRYVFPDDPKERPTGAVIVEVLQVQTWDRDGGAETIYLAMDETDIRELRNVLDRAIDKTKTLIDMLEETNMTYFRLDGRGL